MHMRSFLLGAGLLLAATAFAQHTPFIRPAATAICLPEKAITIDGDAADWLRAGDALERGKIVSESNDRWLPADTDFGPWSGAADSSMTAWVATDRDNLYVFAVVKDQVLVNSADAKGPFNGDDFEIFISAGPPEARFAEKKDENYRQLVFVPAYAGQWTTTLVWQAQENPGLAAASRVTADGYTIEVQVPKALFPYWKAHPEQEAIGFDCQINDADAPGIDCHHPAIKGARQLLSLGRHFQSPALMGLLTFSQVPVKLGPGNPFTDVPAGVAGTVLEQIAGKQAASLSGSALEMRDWNAQQAGAMVLALRPELTAPIARLQALLNLGTEQPEVVARKTFYAYAMMALAKRGKLPLQYHEVYSKVTDAPLKLTWLWCLGANGDRAATPLLTGMLKDPVSRIRMQSALALEMLHDPAALPALQEMEKADKDLYCRQQATQAIKAITAK